MPVPTTITDLSETAGSNSPAGTDLVVTVDDYIRGLSAVLKAQHTKGSDLASASTLTVPVDHSYFVVTGTTTINALSANYNGRIVALKFSSSLQLTHSASLILPTGGNIQTAAGDTAIFVNEDSAGGVWRCLNYSSSASGGLLIWGGTVAGTSDAITLSPAQSVSVLSSGLTVAFTPTATNTTTTPTVNISALGAKTVKRRTPSGKVAIFPGDIASGVMAVISYDGTDFILESATQNQTITLTSASSLVGLATQTWTGIPSNATEINITFAKVTYAAATTGVSLDFKDATTGYINSYINISSSYGSPFTATNVGVHAVTSLMPSAIPAAGNRMSGTVTLKRIVDGASPAWHIQGAMQWYDVTGTTTVNVIGEWEYTSVTPDRIIIANGGGNFTGGTVTITYR